MIITHMTFDNEMAKFYADCMKCNNRAVKNDGNSVCLIKRIDCSVRKGQRPCSHFKPVIEKKATEYLVHMTATAVQKVKAYSSDDAAKKADWCSAEITDWEISEVEKI